MLTGFNSSRVKIAAFLAIGAHAMMLTFASLGVA